MKYFWQGNLAANVVGTNATDFTTQGTFGAEGFKSIQTDDSFNQSLRAYFASFKGLDDELAKHLTSTQQQRIADVLGSQGQRAGSTRRRRADGLMR